MNILEVIKDRRSVRAFKPDSVAKGTIAQILELAINAPSANNLQPWEFIVVMDKEKERLSRTLIKAYREKQLSCSSGAVKPLPQVIKQRGVQTEESLKRYAEKIGVPLDNFVNEGSCNFYGAPVAIIMCLDDSFSNRQMIDIGTVLGFGLPPGIPSWGVLINSSQTYLQTDPQLALWPGLALSLSVYGINMFGDSIRDLLDPR